MTDAALVLDEFHGYYLEDLKVGMMASYAKTVTDIVLFAGISGDVNPIHLNYEFASTTNFKSTITHGMLTASFISTVLGTKLPGPGCVYLRQTMSFRAPVRAGDTVVTRAMIKEVDHARGRVILATSCTVAGKPVLDGEAVMSVARRSAA